MAAIVNLNRARKQKARVDKTVQATQNRIVFGRTKAEKSKAAAERTIAQKLVDAHKRETD